MPDWNKLSTVQYLGSKCRLLESICPSIVENQKINTVVDLFAGTGSVGYALSPYKRIISNDLEYYAYVLNEAELNGCEMTDAELQRIVGLAREKYGHIQICIADAIQEEDHLLALDPEEYRTYAYFSENTPSVFNPETEIRSLKQLEKLVSTVVPGAAEQNTPFQCLFLTYFSNAYFGIRQCCQIDALMAVIIDLPDKHQQYVLLAALMSALSLTASTTTHFAQFLKVKSKNTFKNIRDKRSTNIFELFEATLQRFRENGLLNKRNSRHECFNLDYEECLRRMPAGERTLVYADPPYFKEHYSRYYHVLNTLCLYDYPELAMNPQRKELSVGRYRTDRKSSDFGKRAKVESAFQRLIDLCADRKMSLMISYSENSLVKIDELLKLAESRYKVQVEKIELKHSSQGRATKTDNAVDEYIFFCSQPDSCDVKIEQAAERIESIKPIVDNPGGLIHNYMARKPYNVVSAIIEEFSSKDGIIYDPMMGSGTTLIEASKLGRRAIGTDINPVATNLCSMSLTKWDLDRVNALIDEFVEKVSRSCSDVYSFCDEGQNRVIERCHFDVADGELIPTSYWYKVQNGKKLSGRKKANAGENLYKNYGEFEKRSLTRLTNHVLIPNSRIAIKEGASVFDYFCNRNLAALDKIFSILDGYKGTYGYEVLEIIVSSSINLIKLSDKKASSQIPFWLPKKNVTSRNATFIIEQKALAMKKGLQFLSESCKTYVGDGISIYNSPAQSLSEDKLPEHSIDLVITDPPYTDQVPYMEYNQLWYYLNGLEEQIRFKDELVVSDAPGRNKSYDDFNEVLTAIINRTAKALKKNGIFTMFYHSFDLKSWKDILLMMQNAGLRYVSQIPTAMPRKSFKTVMSPRCTLDGNYLLIFVKDNHTLNHTFTGNINDAVERAVDCARKIIQSAEHTTTQDLYDRGMLRESFEDGYLAILADKYKTFADVIENNFKYENGYWEEK